ncbi:thioredoxin-like protein [Xylariaceae sp. FL1651]|nr:thioredoxin-like protein [Xylariaceae sp. FL1651]
MSTNFLRIVTQSALRRPAFPASKYQVSTLRRFQTTSPKMTVHNLETKAAFDEAIKNNKVVLLDCFATWCGPCKAIAPVLAKMSNEEQYKDVFFGKIDVDDLPELSQELGITAMPTFMIFKDGEAVPADKLVGASPQGLQNLISKNI